MAAEKIRTMNMDFLVKLIESGDIPKLEFVTKTLNDFYGEKFGQNLIDGAFTVYSARKTISGLIGEKRND